MDFETAAIQLLLKQRAATVRGKPAAISRSVRRLALESISTFDTGAHVYASTQLQIPVEIANIALAMGKRIAACDVVELESEPHVTVRWGLEEDDVDLVKALVMDFGPIAVRLGKTSIFPASESGKGDVVKIDVESPALHRLHKLLARLPHTSTHKAFHPHLTLSYAMAGCGGKYVGMDDLAGDEFTVSHLTFSERSGRRHDVWLCGSRADLSTWDESQHPRGKPENKGEFAEKAAVESRSPDSGDRSLADVSAHVSKLIHANTKIPVETRQGYEKTLHEVLGNLSPVMRAEISKRIGEIRLYRSTLALTNQLFPGERYQTGGVWEWGEDEETGELHIDGDAPSGIGRQEIYAHELAHVFDYQRRFSNTPEWQEIWASEIDKDNIPLSKYACESPSEGFAEYGRLFGEGNILLARTFPKAYAFWRSVTQG